MPLLPCENDADSNDDTPVRLTGIDVAGADREQILEALRNTEYASYRIRLLVRRRHPTRGLARCQDKRLGAEAVFHRLQSGQ